MDFKKNEGCNGSFNGCNIIVQEDIPIYTLVLPTSNDLTSINITVDRKDPNSTSKVEAILCIGNTAIFRTSTINNELVFNFMDLMASEFFPLSLIKDMQVFIILVGECEGAKAYLTQKTGFEYPEDVKTIGWSIDCKTCINLTPQMFNQNKRQTSNKKYYTNRIDKYNNSLVFIEGMAGLQIL